MDRDGFHAFREVGIGIVGDDQVHLPGFQEIHAFRGGLIGHLDVDIGIFLVKLVQIRDQEIAADCIAGSDAQLAAAQGAGFHELGFSTLNQVDGRLYVAQKNLTLRRQLYPLGAADEESDTQFLFQHFDRLADG